MKLSSAEIGYVLNQFEADVVPASHPLEKRLMAIFGDHTFLLNGVG